MSLQGNGGREFTGRHMLLIMLGFFGVIVAVNIGMAVFARTSWTGLVVQNSYVASQEFNGKVAAVRAQQSLGWKQTLEIVDREVRFALSDRDGRPIAVSQASLTLRSPRTDTLDRTLALGPNGHVEIDRLANGVWILEMRATTTDGTSWHETIRAVFRDGRQE